MLVRHMFGSSALMGSRLYFAIVSGCDGIHNCVLEPYNHTVTYVCVMLQCHDSLIVGCLCPMITAPQDYISVSGSVLIRETSPVQCVAIAIVLGSESEADEECFMLSLSMANSERGVVVSPNSASVCISDEREGEKSDTLISFAMCRHAVTHTADTLILHIQVYS